MRKIRCRAVAFMLALLSVVVMSSCNITVEFTDSDTDATVAGTEVQEENSRSQDETAKEIDPKLQGPYEVERVVDGDTIIIYLDGERTRVRFSNVDTPESVAGEETGKQNTAEGFAASDYTKKLLPAGSKVYLEYDNKTRDQYDRILAYVYLEDGETMIQRLLLTDGMAKVFNDKQNKRYTEEFFTLQDETKAERLGIWG